MNDKKLRVPNKVFKHWVIIAKTLKDRLHMKSLQSLEYANKTLEAYIDCWIFEKSDEEMWAITQTLESYYDKALLKEFYWDYSLELQNMKDGERYVWLLQEMKNILALAKDDDLTRAYSKKLEEEYFEWIKDSELFD